VGWAVSRLGGLRSALQRSESGFREKTNVFELISTLDLEISTTELNLQSLSEQGFRSDLGLSKSEIIDRNSEIFKRE
jgi:hypothetical protein